MFLHVWTPPDTGSHHLFEVINALTGIRNEAPNGGVQSIPFIIL
jgi:uncharacterized protein (DUF58 family)